MSNLKAFFSQNALKIENVKCVISKRFLDEQGNPIEWEIKAITNKEDEQIRKECTRNVKVAGKFGAFVPETDYTSACTVYPNLFDVELQNSYGVMGEDELLKVMLQPGEYSDYVREIQTINGFDTSMNELVEEAKN